MINVILAPTLSHQSLSFINVLLVQVHNILGPFLPCVLSSSGADSFWFCLLPCYLSALDSLCNMLVSRPNIQQPPSATSSKSGPPNHYPPKHFKGTSSMNLKVTLWATKKISDFLFLPIGSIWSRMLFTSVEFAMCGDTESSPSFLWPAIPFA